MKKLSSTLSRPLRSLCVVSSLASLVPFSWARHWPRLAPIKRVSAAELALLLCTTALFHAVVQPSAAYAHGFTADVVDIKRLMNGKYRIYISYTHLQIGEYRQAHIDFTDKKLAIETFQKLVAGAEFFLGDAKGIHFHNSPEQKNPY